MSNLISVIVPVYKVEDYLERCVESIIQQTYCNLEIILINDGSPDNCGKICEDLARTDERIKVIHKENGGLSDARNTGIEVSNGEYLAFIDSDDWVSEKYIETLFNLLENRKSDISVCNFIKTTKEELSIAKSNNEIHEYSNIQALKQLNGKYGVQLVIACGKLYKSDLFKEIKYPVGKIHEDEYVAHKLIYNSNKIVLTTEQLYYYWQRKDSIMGQGYNMKSSHDAAVAFKERAEFYDKKGLRNLSTNAYRGSFAFYRRIVMLEKKNQEYELIEDAKKELKNLKFVLRKRNFSKKYKAFYELYYLFPNIVMSVYEVHRKLKTI